MKLLLLAVLTAFLYSCAGQAPSETVVPETILMEEEAVALSPAPEPALSVILECTALAFREQIDGECYVTYIYCHEGWLTELFCQEGAGLSPADGERVLEAEAFEASLSGGLLTVRIDGEELYFAVREGR